MPRICPISSSAPRPLGAAYIAILLSEVEQEQRPSGNGDRQAIVVGAGLCDGESERAYTGYALHIIRNVAANVFSPRRFGIFFLPKCPPPCFCRNVFAETSGIHIYEYKYHIDMNIWMQVISPNAISPKNLVESFRLKKLGEMTKRE